MATAAVVARAGAAGAVAGGGGGGGGKPLSPGRRDYDIDDDLEANRVGAMRAIAVGIDARILAQIRTELARFGASGLIAT